MKHFRFISYHVFFLLLVVPVMIVAYPLNLIGQLLQAIANGISGALQAHVLGMEIQEDRQHELAEKQLAEFLAKQQEAEEQSKDPQ